MTGYRPPFLRRRPGSEHRPGAERPPAVDVGRAEWAALLSSILAGPEAKDRGSQDLGLRPRYRNHTVASWR
jgi:hypothetical protein